MKSAIWLIGLFITNLVLLGEDHCSLIVKVIDPAGVEVSSIVRVTDRHGSVTTKRHEQGGVKFCDLGILPVTVSVGDEACNQVMVRNVPLRWGKTTVTTLIHDREPCLYDPPPPPIPTCKVLLRIRDPAGVWIGGALIKLGSPYEVSLVTDEFGRAILALEYDTESRGTVTAKGFRPLEFEGKCSRGEPLVEKYLVLTRTGASESPE